MTAVLPVLTDLSPPLTPMKQLPPLYEKWMPEGPCLYRKIPLSAFGNEPRFRAHWNGNQRLWLERGYQLLKDGGMLCVQQWLTKGKTLTAAGLERLERLIDASPIQEEMDLDGSPLNLSPLPWDLESKLFDYQRDPARQLFRALTHGDREWGYPGAADLSDGGIGKTFQTLSAALSTGRKVAVICPKVGRGGWLRAFEHFGAGDPYFIGTYEAVRGNWRPEIVSQRNDGRFEWKNAGEIILILDEAQALRHETLNTECCSAAIRQSIPIIVASATIALSPLEMRFAGRVTGLHQGAEQWDRFLWDHGCMRDGGTWRWNHDLRTLTKIHAKLFPRRGCRVRREDLGEACPETQITVVPLNVPEATEIERQWVEANELAITLERAGYGKRTIQRLEAKARQKVWQRSEMALVGPVAQMARRELEDDRSVACFLHFTASRMALGRALGTTAGFFGGQSTKARQFFEDQFQSNHIHVLVSNIAAGGASVSLHDTTGDRPRSSFIFPGDSGIHMAQATFRVDRVGGKSVSQQFIPCVKGTLSERMVRSMRAKMMRISTINDGVGSSRIKL